ncbi:MAG: organomercurial lyase [Micromonosporaceae bacterium]
METICEAGQLVEYVAQLRRKQFEDNELAGLLGPVMRLIATGRTVSAADVARAANRTVDDVERTLRGCPGADWGSGDRLMGLGIRLRPTPHRLSLGGRHLYACCPFDALMVPIVLDAVVTLESPCRVTGTMVRVRTAPGGLVDVEPESAVMSVLTCADKATPLDWSTCVYQVMFRDRNVAKWWLRNHPGYCPLSVSEAYDSVTRLAALLRG